MVEECDRFIANQYSIVHDPGDPWEGKTLDREGFKERVVVSRHPFPDQRFDVQECFENDRGVAVTWLWSATHRGNVAGFEPTGKRLSMSGATVYLFDEENRISGHWQVTDRLGIFRQLQENRAPLPGRGEGSHV